MEKSGTVIRELLSLAEIEVYGSHPWDIQVHDDRFYVRVLRDSSLGLGESYMEGWWDCPAIDEFVDRALKIHLEDKVRNETRYLYKALRAKILNRQYSKRTFEVGIKHYDLGNDHYQRMLDKRLNYTSGYWKEAKNLDDAQEAKLELVCKKIGAKPNMKILELGCGWGSFAKYAAKKYGKTFYRMWRYYLLCSAGAFRSRTQQLWQIVFTPIGTRQPDCRVS